MSRPRLPLGDEAWRARLPPPPESLVDARQDRVHDAPAQPQERRVLARGWLVWPEQLVGDREIVEHEAQRRCWEAQSQICEAVFVEIREADPPEGSEK